MTNEVAAPAPDWFRHAVDLAALERRVTVDGCELVYRLWGDVSRPALVLLHGAMAHANWWDFLAPFFADHYCVLAPHLSGMGESGHRDQYSIAGYSDEVVAILDDVGLTELALVAGHSLGGAVALTCGHRHADRFSGVVMLDSAVFPADIPSPFDPAKAPYRPKTICPDYESAVERFFLLPQQPVQHDYIFDYVRRHSVAQMQGGWSWKFDDALFRKLTLHEQWRELEKLQRPLAVIYGDRSAVFAGPARDYVLATCVERGWPALMIPDGHHHLMLESPRAVLAGLQGLLASWP